MMDKETETALIFAATIIMQQVCDNPKLSGRQRDKMRKWAGILSDLADKEEKNNA
jgi:transcriptional accessory protein Tex/SPT6